MKTYTEQEAATALGLVWQGVNYRLNQLINRKTAVEGTHYTTERQPDRPVKTGKAPRLITEAGLKLLREWRGAKPGPKASD